MQEMYCKIWTGPQISGLLFLVNYLSFQLPEKKKFRVFFQMGKCKSDIHPGH